MKKAVFFDIDGTIWDEHMQIPASTVTAVQRLRENGHYAFLCSG
ncbi:MAG: HAD hydrolase family protein, partial [Clostridiales bacterium]|nr:HAD hydrolase family protein [Clostridiales bacterium]